MASAGNNEADRRLHTTVGLVVLLGAGCVAWAIWSVSIWSWVGREMLRTTPTGTGNSGQ